MLSQFSVPTNLASFLKGFINGSATKAQIGANLLQKPSLPNTHNFLLSRNSKLTAFVKCFLNLLTTQGTFSHFSFFSWTVEATDQTTDFLVNLSTF